MDPDQPFAPYEEAAALAWAKYRQRTGLPESHFSDDERERFIDGYAACLRDVTETT